MRDMRPSLLFNPGDVSGWTPVGISSFQGKPTSAIRELIQNSLDASAAVKGQETARVRFQIDPQCPIYAIPAIKAYRKAFKETISEETLASMPLSDNGKTITDEIRTYLEKRTCECLYVMDNGIGLDKKRMTSLLSDGVSMKDTEATGSFGIGHIVAFPASGLRYILYGGLAAGRRIASGHAILASRPNAEKREPTLSKDGYFAKQLHGENLFQDRYTFPEDDEVPDVINERLDWIGREWGQGSVVMIPCFKGFKEGGHTDSLAESIFRAAACNFFEAIDRGKLIIEVTESGAVESLNKDTLINTLEKYKEEKRRTHSFLSGSKAYEAFLTLRDGRSAMVETEVGQVEVITRCPVDSARTRLHLCRNGMWVTDDIPGLRAYQFGKVKPFHAILPLRRNKSFNRLVRKSEGPLHDEVDMGRLDPTDRRKLQDIFRAIREYLKKEIPELKTDAFRPDDIFVLSHGLLSGKFGKATSVTRNKRPDSGGSGSGGGSGGGTGAGKGSGSRRKKSGEFKRSGRYIPARALVKHTKPRSCDIAIIPDGKAKMGEIRFALDENLDITCDALSQEAYISIDKDGLLVNDNQVEDQHLIRDGDHIKGILLGEIDKGKEYTIKMDYTVPADLPIKEDQEPALIVELMSRQARKKDGGA